MIYISEFKMLTSNYQAEFGRSGGGAIQIVTKSGTDQFHGTGFYFHRHEQFNANSFFNNLNSRPETPYRYTTAGATIGGPLRLPKAPRNKLFFFVSSEQIRELTMMFPVTDPALGTTWTTLGPESDETEKTVKVRNVFDRFDIQKISLKISLAV
jgi:hypothetical protein